ncbi:amino acid transporter, partial [Singulisphaera rosea]
MAQALAPKPSNGKTPAHAFREWLLEGQTKGIKGPASKPNAQHEHPWWQVMCLTGVDYFSTLGYQPGIAALAAGALSPIATLILVLLTLFGALPIYGRVARESPHGEGSIAMLEHLLAWWKGKLFILALLGFVATDFIITITLSAADATAHIVENPFSPAFLRGHEVGVTLTLVALLGAVFLKGFKEAMGIAVALVAVYLALNAIVVGYGLARVASHPSLLVEWKGRLFTAHGNPLAMLGISLLLFPKLALGLSGFETGVAVMPLVRGEPADSPDLPEGRIRHTRKLLIAAALIMSVYLLASSLVTTLLIPP